ncbi:hypothetical protein BpHYR1_029220 [Brachionus plicatilis]|uniref:Uncharacterized protein n=1 Tax=Brachionus plicatilis TaxID=10195 RepID=A0A3M7S4G5_BRAPC|nr:hypothetical protein BpHYR1_029220 [Brachionus plicatilis]
MISYAQILFFKNLVFSFYQNLFITGTEREVSNHSKLPGQAQCTSKIKIVKINNILIAFDFP